MPNFVDLVGRRFTRLVVVSLHSKGPTKWLCRCDCGEVLVVRVAALANGSSKSCGCFRREWASENGKKRMRHGQADSAMHRTWINMRDRCRNKNHKQFAYYGGRGITVCERWAVFENFVADMGLRPPGLSLDRKDTNGNYEPLNCRWATTTEQANNKRNNRIVLLGDRRMTCAQAAAELGVSVHRIYKAADRGVDIELLRGARPRRS